MKVLATLIFNERPIEDLNWVILVLVITMGIVVTTRTIFSNNFESLVKFDRFQEIKDNQNLFGIVFQIVLAVLIGTIVVNYIQLDEAFIMNSLSLKVIGISIGILLFFTIRSVLSKMAIYSFKVPYDQNLQLKTYNFFRVYSVGLLWCTVLLYYFSNVPELYLLLTAAMGLLLIRILTFVKLYQNQSKKQSKIWYYNILYLCTLEILPVLVVLKSISN